jgi:hypothetical protein
MNNHDPHGIEAIKEMVFPQGANDPFDRLDSTTRITHLTK